MALLQPCNRYNHCTPFRPSGQCKPAYLRCRLVPAASNSAVSGDAAVLKKDLVTTVTRLVTQLLHSASQLEVLLAAVCMQGASVYRYGCFQSLSDSSRNAFWGAVLPHRVCMCVICRLNSEQDGDNPELQKQLLSLVQQLAALNPTPRPAESQRINGRCGSAASCLS